jgi:hypothetical protein
VALWHLIPQGRLPCGAYGVGADRPATGATPCGEFHVDKEVSAHGTDTTTPDARHGTPEHRQDDRAGRPVTGDGARRIQTFTTTPE